MPCPVLRRCWKALVRVSIQALSLAMLLSTLAQAAVQGAPRHALVIGNSRYTHVSVLPNVANDLADMCDGLKRLRFRTTCLPDVPTREKFLAALESFVDGVPPGADAVLYYGGHAVQVSGENYLIPTEASEADARGWLPQFVRLSEIFQLLERQRAGFRFIVLDACRNNPDAAAVPGIGHAGTDNLRALMRSVRSGGRFATYGIAAVRDAPPDTLVLFGTGAGKVAFDGDRGERNGALTKQLLVQIKTPCQNIDQLLRSVTQSVGDETERRYGQRQSPAHYGTYSGDFCFEDCPRGGEEKKRANPEPIATF